MKCLSPLHRLERNTHFYRATLVEQWQLPTAAAMTTIDAAFAMNAKLFVITRYFVKFPPLGLGLCSNHPTRHMHTHIEHTVAASPSVSSGRGHCRSRWLFSLRLHSQLQLARLARRSCCLARSRRTVSISADNLPARRFIAFRCVLGNTPTVPC